MTTRRCACPRKEPMTGMPDTAKYRYPESCRKRAYKAKLKREAEAVGLTPKPPEGVAVPQSFIEGALKRALSPRARAQVEQQTKEAA